METPRVKAAWHELVSAYVEAHPELQEALKFHGIVAGGRHFTSSDQGGRLVVVDTASGRTVLVLDLSPLRGNSQT